MSSNQRIKYAIRQKSSRLFWGAHPTADINAKWVDSIFNAKLYDTKDETTGLIGLGEEIVPVIVTIDEGPKRGLTSTT